jgi:hypothetical protein
MPEDFLTRKALMFDFWPQRDAILPLRPYLPIKEMFHPIPIVLIYLNMIIY